MNGMMIFPSDYSELDTDEVRNAFQKIPGCRGFREGGVIGALLECEFPFLEDSAILRFSDDRKAISVSKYSDAGLQATLELKQNIKRSLRVIDVEYSFDVELDQIDDLESLRRATSE